MYIDVPEYDDYGFKFEWENGFCVKSLIDNRNLSIVIEANSEGLLSLAKILLSMAQKNVPENEHIHLDEYNSLEDNSNEIIIIKKNFDKTRTQGDG